MQTVIYDYNGIVVAKYHGNDNVEIRNTEGQSTIVTKYQFLSLLFDAQDLQERLQPERFGDS